VPKIDKTVCDAKTQTIRCEVCKDEIPLPLGSVDWVVRACNAFTRTHLNCNGRKGKTTLAIPPNLKTLVEKAIAMEEEIQEMGHRLSLNARIAFEEFSEALEKFK